MEPTEAFTVLELPITASVATIEDRYKELARSRHPDRGGSDGQMTELNGAREVALEFAGREKSLSVRDVVDIVRAAAGVSEEDATRQRYVARAANVRESVLTRTIAPAQHARLVAGAFGGFAAVAAAIAAFVTDVSQDPSIAVAVGILAGVSTVITLLAHLRVEYWKGLVDALEAELDDRSTFVNLLLEFERPLPSDFNRKVLAFLMAELVYGRRPPIMSPLAILRRMVPLAGFPTTLVGLIGQMGPDQSSRMIIAKGLANGYLIEHEADSNGTVQIMYSVKRMSSSTPEPSP